jgi:hypothetical protein
MEESVRYPKGRYVVAAIVLVCTIASAQPADPSSAGLSLDAVLMRLQIRRWEYSRNVPDFFADELVTSELRGMRLAPIRAVTESLFRLRRTSEPGVYPPDLAETRTVRRTNGVTVAQGNSIAGPAILINAFSNGLSTITLSQKTCYDFTLSHHRDVHNVAVFAIDYRMKPGAETTGYCAPWRGVSGQAIVEADTLNILHFDMHVPRYPITAIQEGPWRWSIDYAPVTFDGATYSLPRRIESVSESLDGRFMWTFIATYRNYHKTTVHSHIITSTDDIDPPPPQ